MVYRFRTYHEQCVPPKTLFLLQLHIEVAFVFVLGAYVFLIRNYTYAVRGETSN